MIEAITRDFADELSSNIGSPFPWQQASLATTWGMRLDGVPAAAWGYNLLWEGVALNWGITDRELVAPRPISVFREYRKWLTWVCDNRNIRQMRHLASTIEGMKLAELSGFELECVWIGADPDGADLFVYVYHRRV